MKPPRMVPQICVRNMTRGGILTVHKVSIESERMGRGLTVFAHLEITRQVDSVGNDVVRPCSEIHVTHGLSRKHETSQHL